MKEEKKQEMSIANRVEKNRLKEDIRKLSTFRNTHPMLIIPKMVSDIRKRISKIEKKSEKQVAPLKEEVSLLIELHNEYKNEARNIGYNKKSQALKTEENKK